jgi:replicative DNA helicase
VRSGTLDLIILDYLQLMRAEHPTGNRVEDVSAFSRRLKHLARELDWPVIAVSQLDRGIEQRPGGSDHPDGQPPPLPTDRGDRLGRRASVDRALTGVAA